MQRQYSPLEVSRVVVCAWLALVACCVDARYTCQRSYAGHGHITCQKRNPYCHILDDRLRSQERTDILLAHNSIRREAAKGLLKRYGLPAAANMKKLEWDDDLANNAQAHAEVTCQLKHDHPNERFTGLYAEVGQNIYITEVWNQELKPDPWAIVVEELWGHEEAAKLRANSFGQHLKLRGHDLKTIGHLTQLLWADTEKVGCGRIYFEGRNGATSDLRTCDYGEGGNVIGGAMYIEGPACSACPSTHPYCDDGLCSRTPGYNFAAYITPVHAPTVHVSYVPTHGGTSAVQHHVIPATAFWWNSPSAKTLPAAHVVHNHHHNQVSVQAVHYRPTNQNHGGQHNPYVHQPQQHYNHHHNQHQQHQKPLVYQNTYNYKGYALLHRRRRRSVNDDGGENQRRTEVL